MSQAKWDGEAGDGLWETATNWTGNQLPSATDDIVLDNSLVTGNYTVSLPGSATAVTIKSIVISPGAAHTIQLTLPASSMAVPAFTAAGPGYGITINNGGVLLNSSGSSAGAAIIANDSIRINNGGQYTHNTRSSHAAMVTVLSKLPGTEKGIFKFDAPGGGYTFASTNRSYGTLVLSAEASGGNQAYATSAAGPLTVNGDFIIETGVTVNLDITAATVIKGNYMQQGGVFNLASQPNNNIVYIGGHLLQTAGLITETSSGLPLIELNGDSNQDLQVGGSITNSVGFSVNNAAGITLLGNLSLPYLLNLSNGIVNAQSFLITLLAGCTINADSTTSKSFINGPLRKEGLSATPHFLFPVGKGQTQRWVALNDATGNYTVEFFKSNPASLASTNGAGINHLSTLEYWNLKADMEPLPSATLALSFDNTNSGGVTDLAALRVAQLLSGVWTDRGNATTTGTAGSAGSVVSNPFNLFDEPGEYFSLASSNAFQNPLPLELVSFSSHLTGNTVMVDWLIEPYWQPAGFELQSSADGLHFIALSAIDAAINQRDYHYTDRRPLRGWRYYRLKAIEKDGSIFYSKTSKLDVNEGIDRPWQLRPSVAINNTSLYLNAPVSGTAQISIISTQGNLIQRTGIFLQKGNNIISLPLQKMAAGIYIISVYRTGNEAGSTRLIKLN